MKIKEDYFNFVTNNRTLDTETEYFLWKTGGKLKTPITYNKITTKFNTLLNN